MKIDRLIGILSILLQREKVTAPYLAEKFEVSRRTINRDIEDICKAGIPLVTSRGPGGGISIMEGYRMDRTLITSGEMEAILVGLRSIGFRQVPPADGQAGPWKAGYDKQQQYPHQSVVLVPAVPCA